jgi:hypothetical protein
MEPQYPLLEEEYHKDGGYPLLEEEYHKDGASASILVK